MKRGLTLPKPLGQDSLFDDEDVSPDQQEKAKGSFQKAIATTKTNLKQELIHQINEIDAAEADSLFFMPRAAIYAAMPYRQKRGDDGNFLTTYERRNNALTLKLQTIAPEIGLPSGAFPRILLAYMTSTAMRTHSPYIELPNSVYSLMDTLGLNTRGGSTILMRNQLDALRNALISIEWNREVQAGDEIVRIKKDRMSLIIEESVVWEIVAHRRKRLAEPMLGGYYVKLSDYFFDEICASPVPIDLRAMIALQSSPLAMDIYAWCTYQASFLRKPKTISWSALMVQFGTYDRVRDFRTRFSQAMKSVLEVYPELRVSLTTQGIRLSPSPTHVARSMPMRVDQPEIEPPKKPSPEAQEVLDADKVEKPKIKGEDITDLEPSEGSPKQTTSVKMVKRKVSKMIEEDEKASSKLDAKPTKPKAAKGLRRPRGIGLKAIPKQEKED